VKDEILSYWDMCSREGMSLQRGMYLRVPPKEGIILMSRRPNAPYADEMNHDESELLYEGHDVNKTVANPDPKAVDQPWVGINGKLTENGKFARWVDDFKLGKVPAAVFRVYEKMRPGIWTDRGLYLLNDYSYEREDRRKVFKFKLGQAGYDDSLPKESLEGEQARSRQIPSWVKQLVYRRDKGICVICGSKDQLHFDHDFPYSRGGTSVLPENVRILCARHNLAKSAKIE
jgi:hypothetical protein